MKVAIAGAHSQGKTTLIEELKYNVLLRDFHVLGNITRGIKDLGIDICEDGSDWSQYLVTAKHIEHFFHKGNCLLDRCILDGLAYTKALYNLGVVSERVIRHVEHVGKEIIHHRNTYDVIFYIKPELPLVDDGVRTVDQGFFDDVVKCFNGYMIDWNIPVVTLSGSIEERYEAVINRLKDKL